MKCLTEAQIESFLKSLACRYDVWVPVRLHDGTRSLGRLGEGPLALAGGALPQKPTRMFFPQMDVILSLQGQEIRAPAPLAKPLLVTGFTAEDLDCLAFIDRFYGEKYRDTVYFNKRENAVMVAVTGRCGKDGRTLKVSRGNCDLELVRDGAHYLLLAHSATGRALANPVRANAETSSVPRQDWAARLDGIRAEAGTVGEDDRMLLERASQLLLEDKVPEAFWEELADRCIACTTCNLVCPTCTCFDVFDRTDSDQDQRSRMWDSCQLDGFMREASGHNPMGKQAQRTRRRIHHKLGADPRRWGQITCMLCGRCDDACPTGIGIKAVSRAIVAQYGPVWGGGGTGGEGSSWCLLRRARHRGRRKGRSSEKSQEELTKAVRECSQEMKGHRTMTCARALGLAAEWRVEPVQTGRICNQHKIRLGGCQLGCFS